MSKNASSQMPSNPPALKFVTGGGGKKNTAQETVPSDADFVGPESQNPAEIETKAKKQTSTTPKSRTELPKLEIHHRVHADIRERLLDEQYRQKKHGNSAYIADIFDEALHLGLLQIEKRKL